MQIAGVEFFKFGACGFIPGAAYNGLRSWIFEGHDGEATSGMDYSDARERAADEIRFAWLSGNMKTMFERISTLQEQTKEIEAGTITSELIKLDQTTLPGLLGTFDTIGAGLRELAKKYPDTTGAFYNALTIYNTCREKLAPKLVLE